MIVMPQLTLGECLLRVEYVSKCFPYIHKIISVFNSQSNPMMKVPLLPPHFTDVNIGAHC